VKNTTHRKRIAIPVPHMHRAKRVKDANSRKQRVLIRELRAEVIALRAERGFRAARVPLDDTYGRRVGASAALGINADLAYSNYELGKPTEIDVTYTPGHEPDEILPVGAAL
jgi:hypothetical protein